MRKPKEQGVEELAELRQRMRALKKSGAERKQAERALRESEERLKLAVDGADLGLWTII